MLNGAGAQVSCGNGVKESPHVGSALRSERSRTAAALAPILWTENSAKLLSSDHHPRAGGRGLRRPDPIAAHRLSTAETMCLIAAASSMSHCRAPAAIEDASGDLAAFRHLAQRRRFYCRGDSGIDRLHRRPDRHPHHLKPRSMAEIDRVLHNLDLIGEARGDGCVKALRWPQGIGKRSGHSCVGRRGWENPMREACGQFRVMQIAWCDENPARCAGVVRQNT